MEDIHEKDTTDELCDIQAVQEKRVSPAVVTVGINQERDLGNTIHFQAFFKAL